VSAGSRIRVDYYKFSRPWQAYKDFRFELDLENFALYILGLHNVYTGQFVDAIAVVVDVAATIAAISPRVYRYSL